MEQEDFELELQKESEPQPAVTPGHSAFVKGLCAGIVGIAVIAVVIGGVAAFRYPDSVPVFPAVYRAVNMPAAVVGGTIFSWNELQIHMDALRAQLSLQPETPLPPIDQLRIASLRRALITEAVEQVATRRNIVATSELMNTEYDRIVAALGGPEKIKDVLENKLHWTADEYRERIVRPSVLMNELQKELDNETPEQVEVKAAAQKVLDELKKGGDFAKLAKQHGEDASKDQGGDLGFFKRGAMIPAFEEVVFGLKKGELAPELLHTQFGYHIIQATEIKKDAAGKVTEVRARHILFRSKVDDVLGTTLIGEIKSMRFWQFIHTDGDVKKGLDNPETTG